MSLFGRALKNVGSVVKQVAIAPIATTVQVVKDVKSGHIGTAVKDLVTAPIKTVASPITATVHVAEANASQKTADAIAAELQKQQDAAIQAYNEQLQQAQNQQLISSPKMAADMNIPSGIQNVLNQVKSNPNTGIAGQLQDVVTQAGLSILDNTQQGKKLKWDVVKHYIQQYWYIAAIVLAAISFTLYELIKKLLNK